MNTFLEGFFIGAKKPGVAQQFEAIYRIRSLTCGVPCCLMRVCISATLPKRNTRKYTYRVATIVYVNG